MNNGTKEESECFLLLILVTDDFVYRTKKGKIVDWALYDSYLVARR
jgi:hypothetical protein